MSREEVQISDLEPSIIGEDVTKYAIQIRGVDGNGNEGPWSTILEYESPELLPSLQSNNYVPDQSGWFLDNDGTFEVNDGFIRGTLRSSNYVTGVSGWALDQNGVVEFDQGVFRGALEIGTNTFRVDSNGNLSIGGSSASNAPFRVNTNGQILAMSIDGDFIQSRTIRANRIRAGEITADEISSNYIYTNTLVASQVTSGTFDPVRIPNLSADKITAGTLNADNINVTNLDASNINRGTIGSNRIPNLDAGKITFGTLQGVSINTSSITGISLVSNGSFDVQSGRLRLFIGGNVTSTARFEADNGFRVGSSGVLFSQSGSNGLIQFSSSSAGLIITPAVSAVSSTANVRWNTSNNRLERFGSSIRYKEEIKNSSKIPNLLDVTPVTFKYKCDDKNIKRPINYGLIAEDLDERGLNILVDYLEDGETPESVDYAKIGVALIPYVKELYDRIEQLEEQLNGN